MHVSFAKRKNRVLDNFTRDAIRVILMSKFRGARLRWAARVEMSPRQQKEVIQVAHSNVGSVASLGALAGGEVHY